MRTPLIRLGLGIYALALFTSFMHVWEVYSRFGAHFPVLDRVWVALGVALGLDLTALYYSYLSVLGVKSARVGSYLAVSLVWFTVAVSLFSGTQTTTDKVIALVLSTFVLVTTFFLGKVLGELAGYSPTPPVSSLSEETPPQEEEVWLSTKEAASLLGLSKSAFLAKAKKLGLEPRMSQRAMLWRKSDLEAMYAELPRRNE
ncbi:hypothetical protein G20c_12 [Thermus phage G20c]|nr:hypothetical protein G20c_12 [Thermus phage G20c]